MSKLMIYLRGIKPHVIIQDLLIMNTINGHDMKIIGEDSLGVSDIYDY